MHGHVYGIINTHSVIILFLNITHSEYEIQSTEVYYTIITCIYTLLFQCCPDEPGNRYELREARRESLRQSLFLLQ